MKKSTLRGFLLLCLSAILVTAHSCIAPNQEEDQVVSADDFGGNGSGGGYSYKFGDRSLQVTDALRRQMTNLGKQGFGLPGEPALKQGDILVFTICDEFPDGYAARVSSVTAAGKGGSYDYSMEQAALEDVFESLSLSQSSLNLTQYVKSIVDESGNEVPFTKADGGIQIEIEKEYEVAEGITVTPVVTLGMNLSFGMEVGLFKLKEAHARLDTDASLDVNVGITALEGKAEVTFGHLDMILAAIPVGPVVITPQISAELVYKISGEISANLSFGVSSGFYVQADYSGGKLTGDGGFKDVEMNKFAINEVQAKAELECGPDFSLLLSVYGGALGVGLEAGLHEAMAIGSSVQPSPGVSQSAWLSGAYLEPSLKLPYGGKVVMGYKWSVDFDLPGDLGWTPGKLFFIGQLGPALTISEGEEDVTFISSVRGNAMYVGNMYMKVFQVDDDGNVKTDSFVKVPFSMPRTPADYYDEVVCAATMQDYDPQKKYYADGPYMDVKMLGRDWSLQMSPYQETERFFGGKDNLREKLIQLYKDTGGDNWINNTNWCSDKPLDQWYGVEFWEGLCVLMLQENNLRGSVTITDCPGLYHVRVNDNFVESVDVSRCMNLREADCVNNEVVSFIFSDCPSLEFINCGGNKLTSLSFQGCPSLHSLSCWRNSIQQLDFSNVPKLAFLYCNDNLLTSLDLSDLPLLKHIDCGNNPLSSLDLSACKDLEWLLCRESQGLLSVNVSGCSNLTLLDVSKCSLQNLNVSGCSSLSSVKCQNQQLVSLNVAGCYALEELDCSGNLLPSLDVSSCTNLKELDCSNNRIIQQITSEDRIPTFYYDRLFDYLYDEGGNLIDFWQNDYGWYYDGEPEKGYHGR